MAWQCQLSEKQGAPRPRVEPQLSYNSYVVSLWAFLTLSYFKSNCLVFSQGTATVTVNSTVVNENVWTTFLLNETKTFFVVEPLNSAGYEL